MSLMKIKRKGEKLPGHDLTNDVLDIKPEPSDQVGMSDRAALRIAELALEKGLECLRVAIRGGGCSGLSIHYELTSSIGPHDKVFIRANSKLVIDKKSLAILGGATLDCREYLGSKEFFLVNNPAAKQCSCGQSFSL